MRIELKQPIILFLVISAFSQLVFPIASRSIGPDFSSSQIESYPLKASKGEFHKAIQIEWSKAKGASNYFIIRKEKDVQSDWALIEKVANNRFTDYNVKEDVIYEYAVLNYGLSKIDLKAFMPKYLDYGFLKKHPHQDAVITRVK